MSERSYWEYFGIACFVIIPLFVLLIIIISLIISMVFSIYYVQELVFVELLDFSANKFKYIVDLASLLEFGLFISLIFIITRGLFEVIFAPFLEKGEVDLISIRDDFNEKVKKPFLSIIISIIALYILETATKIVQIYSENAPFSGETMVIRITSLVAFAVVALIISIIIRT